MELQKSTESATANPAWITELTDAEMEATTGGSTITRRNLNALLEVARVAANPPLSNANRRRLLNWYRNLSPSDRAVIARLSLLND